MHTPSASRELGRRSPKLPALSLLVSLLCAQPAHAQSQEPTRRNADTVRTARRAAPNIPKTESRVDASVPEDWLTQVSASIRREEYHYASLDTELWSAPNRSQELRSRVDRRGIEVFPRETNASGEGAAWKVRLGTASFGRVGDVWPVASRSVSVEGERAELDHGSLIESFVNDERGIEQGWTIANRPPGVELLVIGLAIDGDLSLRVDEGGRSGVFVDGAGEPRARYTGLVASDATGRRLSARMLPGPAGLELRVDDSGAVYPVTVDPLMTSAAWTAESNLTSALFGYSVSSAGDVNGDGYSDVIVGAVFYDGGEFKEGRAYVFHGSATGLSTTAAWTDEPNQESTWFGHSVETAGDVNGDGYSDVIVGAYWYDNGETDEGRAFVYHGSPTGLGAVAAWTAEPNQAGAVFGASVSTAGDVNGDGYSDVIYGAPFYENGEPYEGRAYVYHGSASGLGATEAWTAESNQMNASYGVSVSTAGDVDADGYSDVIVSAFLYDNGESDEGRAFVYHGSASGLSATAAWTAESNQAGAELGAVSSAGDINGDGYSDVIVSAGRYTNGQSEEGRAYVYHGSAAGLSATAAWTVESNQAVALLSAVSSAGDINGDGYSDVIVGAFGYDNGQLEEGRAYVYFGSAAGLAATAGWTGESNQVNGYFGWSVSNAGDVNGDGYSDVIVGALQYSNGEVAEGRAYVYHGSAAGLGETEAWTAEPNQVTAYLGYSVSTAGDVNGDGYSDVIVGAYAYDNGETDEGRVFVYRGSATGLSTSATWTAESNQASALFGFFVSTAGDVNGDGYSDVIVGAPAYDNGHSDEGRAYVYHGSAAGLRSIVAWTAESNQVFASFGVSVSTADDVNGDGYSDVIVGASGYDNGESAEGRAYVYHGSITGLRSIAAWVAESNQANAEFGSSVSTAGDVNGDGYSDVIVGAAGYTNGELGEGRAYDYHGSVTGLRTTAAWTAESNQVKAFFGASVSTAGDVNGDAYSDVIVGAGSYDNGQVNEGRAYVYHGSPTGIRATAAWTAESNQANASFGTSVSTAGDVNGDGYSDVIVGASGYDNGESDEGQAYVYHGSATGISADPWTVESDQVDARLGVSVSNAGDVNGDGYSDVIVGAYRYADEHVDEGHAFVYHGNGDDGGLVRALQQRTGTGVRPISVLGNTTSSGLIYLRARFPQHVAAQAWPAPDRSAWLEWEVKPLGTAFDGTGIERGIAQSLLATGGELTFDQSIRLGPRPTRLRFLPETLYHWRARVATNNPLFAHTAWFSATGNNITESKVRKPSSLR